MLRNIQTTAKGKTYPTTVVGMDNDSDSGVWY